MSSIDLKKTHREHYTAGTQPAFVDVPARPYLMIDGTGDPTTSVAYRDAVATLYPLAYGLRKVVKDASGDAYTVMPLEGLWWVDDMRRFSIEQRSQWRWTAMILQPEEVTPDLAATVIASVTAAKGLPSGNLARLESYGDGPAVQVLHGGPYADEGPTIARLHGFIAEQGWQLRGKHHEIYLGDPRKTEPSKLRTIIRQPVTTSAAP